MPVVVLVNRFTEAPSQLSIAVGAMKEGEVAQSIVALAPALLMVGFVLSLIVISCVHLDTLPHESEME